MTWPLGMPHQGTQHFIMHKRTKGPLAKCGANPSLGLTACHNLWREVDCPACLALKPRKKKPPGVIWIGHHAENEVPDGDIIVYHIHGERQYLGTCKFHLRVDCPHLVNWRPRQRPRNWETDKQFEQQEKEKAVIKNHYQPDSIGENQKCKTCWK